MVDALASLVATLALGQKKIWLSQYVATGSPDDEDSKEDDNVICVLEIDLED